MMVVTETNMNWQQEDENTLSKQIKILKMGTYKLSVEFIKDHSYAYWVCFAPPSDGYVTMSETHTTVSSGNAVEFVTVRSGSSNSLTHALQQVAFEYQNHRSFMEELDNAHFNMENAVEDANSQETKDLIGI